MTWGLHGRITLGGAVLIEATLRLGPGVTVIMGPSGSGKSTLLRLLAGLPTAAVLDGQVCRPARIGWMAQDAALQPRLAVGQNVGLMRLLAGQPRDADEETRLLEAVGLKGFADRRVDTLSGGQKARVALARVLMQQAPLVLLDEPFSALDPDTRRRVQDLTRSCLAGRTVLMVTHDMAEALRLADHLVVLRDHKLVEVPLCAPPAPGAQVDGAAAWAALIGAAGA